MRNINCTRSQVHEDDDLIFSVYLFWLGIFNNKIIRVERHCSIKNITNPSKNCTFFDSNAEMVRIGGVKRNV